MTLQETIDFFKALEVTYEEFMSIRKQSYILQWKVRGALKSIISPLPTPYSKYSSKCRREARKLKGKKRGYEVDHKVCLKLLWALGFSVEDANREENLELIKKKDNKRKSFKSNWKVFEEIYLPILTKEQE
jgi:hypothetical protein